MSYITVPAGSSSGGAGSGAANPTTRPTTRRRGDKDRAIGPGRHRESPTAQERTARPTWRTGSGIHGWPVYVAAAKAAADFSLYQHEHGGFLGRFSLRLTAALRRCGKVQFADRFARSNNQFIFANPSNL